MNFTFGALSVVLAALATRQVADVVAAIIALVFVPQFAKAGLMIWLGEYNRSQRAGLWLAGLEQRINDCIGSKQVLGWEQSLAQKGTHMGYPYIATVAIVMGVGYASVVFGIYVFGAALWRTDIALAARVAIVVLVVALASLVEVTFIRFFLKKWRTLRSAPTARTGDAGAAST